MIRKAEPKDISRIAEILVFTKRMKYRAIFHNDDYSFNELQVVKVANEFKDPELLNKVWVYDDGIVKGMMHLEGKEISELYVDYFFWNQGIGAQLLEFAKEKYDLSYHQPHTVALSFRPYAAGKRRGDEVQILRYNVPIVCIILCSFIQLVAYNIYSIRFNNF